MERIKKYGDAMIKIKPHLVYDKNGKVVGVSLKPQEFKLLMEELEDYEDYQLFEERAKKIKKLYSAEEVRAELFGEK